MEVDWTRDLLECTAKVTSWKQETRSSITAPGFFQWVDGLGINLPVPISVV